MKSKKKMPVLEQIEWDFRQIENQSLVNATLWEYGRTSEPLRKSIVTYLETMADGLTIKKRLTQHLKNPNNNSFYPVIISQIPKLKIPREHLDSVLALTHVMLSAQRADFPAPWTSKIVKQEHFLELENLPVLEIDLFPTDPEKIQALKEEAAFNDLFSDDKNMFIMTINLNEKIGNIILEFSKWVRKEAKKHPRKLGQPTQAQTYPLRCLSAYRLHQAGFTFAQAQEFLLKHNDGARLVPIYADASGWSDALRFARQKIKNLASIRS